MQTKTTNCMEEKDWSELVNIASKAFHLNDEKKIFTSKGYYILRIVNFISYDLS